MIPAFSSRAPVHAEIGNAVRSVLRALAARWAAGAHASPARAERPPWEYGLLAIGFAAIALALDPFTANPLSSSHWFFMAVFQKITYLGTSLYMMVIAAVVGIVALVRAGRDLRPRMTAGCRVIAERALFVFVVLAVSGLAAQVIKHMAGRARPRFLHSLGPYHFDVFSLAASSASFPSGHTVTAFSAATAIGFFWPRGRPYLFAFAALIGLSRLMIGAHFLSDVFGGALLGLMISVLVARRFARSRIAFSPTADGFRPRGALAAWRVLSDWAHRGRSSLRWA